MNMIQIHMTTAKPELTSWVVGTDLGCDVVVQGADIFPRHCCLIREGSRWLIQPLDGKVQVDHAFIECRTEFQPSRRVALSASQPLPWPAESDAVVLTVGRAADCDIVVESPGVSGRHAKLIIGPQRTMVLEDCSSKNGIRLNGEPSTRVKAVALTGFQTVYFGASPFDVSTLVNRAEMLLAHAATSIPKTTNVAVSEIDHNGNGRAGIKRKRARSMQLILLNVILPVFVPTIVLGAFYQYGWMPSLPSNNISEVDVDQPKPTQSGLEIAKGRSRDEFEHLGTSLQTHVLESPQSLSNNEPAKAVLPTESVYWVVVQHRENKQWFRLCTGVTIGPRHLLTVGSIAEAAEEMVRNEYQSLSVVHVSSGKLQPVERRWVHPQLTRRLAHAQAATAASVKSKSDNEASDSVTKILNLSWSAAAAVDCVILEIPMANHWLALDYETKLRPQQAVRLCDASFDSKDPFCDLNDLQNSNTGLEPFSENKNITGRVQMLAQELEGIPGQAIVAVESVPQGHNWFGCPCISPSNKLVGMIVYAEDGERLKLEALSPLVIAAVMETANVN